MQDSKKAITPTTYRTTTAGDLLTVSANKLGVELYSGCRTLAAAMDSGAPALGGLARIHGRPKIEALIELQLCRLGDLLNLRRPLTEEMQHGIAEELISTYPSLTMADVQVVFGRVLRGEFGELYESLNMPKVMTWFASYFEERCELGERRTLHNHEKYQSSRRYDRVFEAAKRERVAEAERQQAAMEFKKKKEAELKTDEK